jgi:hypothetical protein
VELETAARRMFLADATVQGYVAGKVFKFELLTHVTGTGGRAVVVRRATGWSAPGLRSLSEYPTLVVENWADCTRSPDGEPMAADAVDNAFALYRVTNRLIHGIRDVVWGAGGDNAGLRVVSAERSAEPAYGAATAPSASGASTNTPLGESAVVIASYALHI